MIRVALYLILVGVIAYGVALVADRPGEVVVTWQGLRIETSLLVLGAAIVAAVVVLFVILGFIRWIARSPVMLARMLRNRRGLRAYEAISQGLIAVGSGDVAAAQRFTIEVQRLAPSEPLALLLSAQAAQLAGDRDAAQRRNDAAGARAFAEEAARIAPALGWAGTAVLEARCRDGDWAGALDLLEQQRRMFDKASYRRRRAVLLTARALALEDGDRDAAKEFALEANKLAADLVPAAALAGRLLAEGGHLRRASRVIDSAWRANPHPELAQAYAELRSGESARERLKRIEAGARRVPGHIEGALAVARAAIEAQEFAKARSELSPYLERPTRRVCVLMARLERSERNDEGRAREWMARALNAPPDPQWTADGYVSDRWLPVSPVTGRIDAFVWRVPLTGAIAAPVIEPELPAPVSAARSPREENAVLAAEPAAGHLPPAPLKAEPVIPLVHAPDDPGPDATEESEMPADQETGWRKIFQ